MSASPLDVFLADCCLEVERRAALAQTTVPVLTEGAHAFRTAISAATRTVAEPSALPVVEQLRDLESPPQLLAALLPALDDFPWEAHSGVGDNGTQVALGRINLVRDFGDVNCGLMLVGAGCAYPLHDHPPQELYLPIVDGGEWRVGGATDFRSLGPDELAYNNPNDRHSVRAGTASPLLALFILWP